MFDNKIEKVSNHFHICYVQEMFHEIFSKYTDEKTVIKLFADVIKCYTAKSRHYHDMNHIYSMCVSWGLFKNKLVNPDVIFMAIIYHDIIYKPIKSNNEEKSSEYFEKNIAPLLNLNNSFVLEVCIAILATKHDEASKEYYIDSTDIQYLLDFDLHVLGTPHESEYEWYRDGVRKEYKIYPDCLYKPGRKKVLESFLKRKSIYLTKDWQVSEKKARKNLRNEIKLYLC